MSLVKKNNSTPNTTSIQDKSPLLVSIIEAIQDKKGNSIKVLDLRNIEEAVADFFIICDAESGTQMNAIANNVEKTAREEMGEKPYKFELSPTWTLVDYIDVVVHVFQSNERGFYDLEGLWEDAVAESFE